MAIAALFSFAACNDTETYKDLRDRELDSISLLASRKREGHFRRGIQESLGEEAEGQQRGSY